MTPETVTSTPVNLEGRLTAREDWQITLQRSLDSLTRIFHKFGLREHYGQIGGPTLIRFIYGKCDLEDPGFKSFLDEANSELARHDIYLNPVAYIEEVPVENSARTEKRERVEAIEACNRDGPSLDLLRCYKKRLETANEFVRLLSSYGLNSLNANGHYDHLVKRSGDDEVDELEPRLVGRLSRELKAYGVGLRPLSGGRELKIIPRSVRGKESWDGAWFLREYKDHVVSGQRSLTASC